MRRGSSIVRFWNSTYPCLPEEVGRARRWTWDILQNTSRVDDAVLIMSELSGNAIRHTVSERGFGSFHLVIAVLSQFVVLSVRDEGGTSTLPRPDSPGDESEHGRGLTIVYALADRVGCDTSNRGNTVTVGLCT
ncbi:ATP-binding protein [Streptomyces yaizuensis]|uniref:ATP-binding protein n=1 Tax=Streptomyces yaizuensis TaxID=2989713 RepID=UPI002B1EA407|nr:ATP-binding protein [Streptomyces sp. YSPA8]